MPKTSFATAFFAVAMIFVTSSADAETPVLRWNGASGDVWDATTANWLDDSENAVAWQPGASAAFNGSGGLVNLAADVTAANLIFVGNGYTLLGSASLSVTGNVWAASGTTNSVAVNVCAPAGLGLAGGGALAVLRTSGPLLIGEGTALISGREFADADISVTNGAALHVLGAPATNANLVANASFEYPALSAGSYAYASSTAVSNWTAVSYVCRQNTAASTAWNSAGSAPDYNHVLILQYGGYVTQTVTVSAEGLYELSFYHFLRNGYPETSVRAYLGGLRVACFMNQAVQFAHQLYVSAPLYLKAGTYELKLEGDSAQGDRSSMIDLVCLAPPSASAAANTLGGLSTLRVVTGATVRMDFTGSLPLARVYLDGANLSAQTFTSAHASGVFAGDGSLYTTAPETVLTWSGTDGNWSDGANWESAASPAAGGSQAYALLFPLGSSSGSIANDLTGTFYLNALKSSSSDSNAVATLSGNGLLFTNAVAGTLPRILQSGPGLAEIAAPLAVRTNLTIGADRSLNLSGTVSFPTPNAYVVSKTGGGNATLSSVSGSPSCYAVYDGALTLNGSHTGARYISTAGPFMSVTAGVLVNSMTNASAAFYLTQSGTPLTSSVFFSGLGDSIFGTRCGGATVTYDAYPYCYGVRSVFDVGTDDTLRILQLIENVNDASLRSYSALVKVGPGTLEIRSSGVNNTTRRAFTGRTVLRNGTLRLSTDDCGTLTDTANAFSGQSYTGLGGALGYNVLTNRVTLGDDGTASTDNLALIANGNGRWIGHDIEVFNKGATVTLGMTTGTVMFAGTITLHRDITLSGPTNGVMVVSNVVAAADFSGTGAPALSGIAGLRIEGAFPSGASLAMGARALRFGTGVVHAQNLAAFQIGGASAAESGSLDIDFGAGANDTIAVTATDGLTLSNTVVNLYYASTGLAFAEPGTYTLFTYAGTLGGDVSLLAVGNPQTGVSYAFSDDSANSRVLLTISNTSGGTSFTWKNTGSGAWDTAANWDSGSVPNGASIIPLFGLAATSSATVTVESAHTVGGLTFNNGSYGYTLSGGTFTLDNGGDAPVLSVLSGTHTLTTTTLTGDTPATVNASGGVLVLGDKADIDAGLDLEAGTLRVAATNASAGSLSASSAAVLEFSGASSALTIDQTSDAAFAGTVKGDFGTLTKQGAATLTLTGDSSAYSGTVAVAKGTLAAKNLATPGTLSIAAAAAVAVLTPTTNGLTGYFYNVSPNTNNFFTLAGMEAHFATLKPDLVSLSGTCTTNLDFGASGTLFPLPYGSGGTRTTYFEAVWRGTISIATANYYTFRVSGDDGFLLAIDGRQLLARPYTSSSAIDGTTYLEAGAHDIVLGYFQKTDAYGLQVQVHALYGSFAGLPNAWLKPYASVGALAGAGSLSLADTNTQFAAAQNTSSTFSGAITAPAGSLFTKSGTGSLTFGGTSSDAAFGSDVRVQGGTLILDSDERLGDSAAVTLAADTQLKLNASETVGALAGPGSVAFGGSVYATSFSGDADSEISTSKTYTHTLDFPSGTSNAVVNGVTFYASAMSGSRNGYGWSVTSGTAPSSTMNASPYDYSYSGVTALLWDFFYGSTDYTLTLSGLTPGKSYEFRLYFRNWNNNLRYLDFTFTAGATLVGTIFHNPDTMTRSMVVCRYTADAAGTLSVRIYSQRSSDTCHLYGLSNEEVSSTTATALTLDTPTGTTFRHTGTLAGSGAITKLGAGNQIFGGTNTVSTPITVQAGTLTFEPNAYVLSGVVAQAETAVAVPYGGVELGGLAGAGTFSLAGLKPYPTNRLYFVTFTNDSMTEISTAKTYTHKLDFGSRTSPATVINGVTFDKVSIQSGTNGVINGYGWTNFPPTVHSGSSSFLPPYVPSSSGVYNLLYDMFYGWSYPNAATMKLTGLVPGKRYEVRFYNRYWGSGNDRTQTFTFDTDGAGPVTESVTFNEDAAAAPSILAYRYTAVSNVLAVTVLSKLNGQTYHLYGLTNEEVDDATNTPAVVRINADSVWTGPITGSGAWTKTGAAALTVSGASTATGTLAVTAGAFGAADGGTATLGPVSVAAGATLFGHGLVGGDVAVASNALLYAGTAAACGTLQIGGSLTLAPGTRLAYRFAAAGSNDTVIVTGQLAFPTNGVVQASALTDGIHAPAKDLFFSSPLPIVGPDDLSGWTVEGVKNASLGYSEDRTQIFFKSPQGTLILIH